MSMKSTVRIFPALFACAALLTACPKKTADLELEAARKSMEDALAKRANDCAKETYLAAEAAIAEAKRLAEAGEIEEAKAKAGEAKTLADQAAAASSPGCAEKADDDGEDPDRQGANANDASSNLSLRLEDALSTIYFDYNEANIREDSKAVLSKVADILVKQPALKLEIEGHCDVRGSTEYNLSLGERRARSVEKYLTTQGVKPDQLAIISYGEERPLDLGDGEDAHQKNRRAELKKLQ